MELTRKQSIIVGISFFAATVAYLLGSGQIDPSLNSSTISESIAANKAAFTFGIIGELLNIVFVCVMGLLLFKAFRRQSKTAATIYLAGRSVEVIFLIISLCFALLALHMTTGNIESYASNYFTAFNIGMIGLGIGGAALGVALLVKRVGPRWLAILGIIGYVSLGVWAALKVVGISAPMILFAPGAVFEILFPIWLIWKGGKRR